MPLYDYIDKDTGGTVELFRPVELRDCVPDRFERIQVPARVGTVRGLKDPKSAEGSVPRALKELEQTVSHGEIARQSGFSTERMKQIWGI